MIENKHKQVNINTNNDGSREKAFSMNLKNALLPFFFNHKFFSQTSLYFWKIFCYFKNTSIVFRIELNFDRQRILKSKFYIFMNKVRDFILYLLYNTANNKTYLGITNN